MPRMKLTLPLEEMKAEARANPDFPLEALGLPVESFSPEAGTSLSPERGPNATYSTDERDKEEAGEISVIEMATALIRQHIGHSLGKTHPLLAHLEEAFPRTDRTINKKSTMVAALGLQPPTKTQSVLEALLEQTMGPTDGSLQKTASTALHYAEDGSSLSVNGLRISEVSSIPFSIVGRLSDLNMEDAEQLGKGAGGTVYRVRHRVNGTEHAVKEIVIGSNEVMAQVKAEISVLWGSSRSDLAVGVSPFVIQCHGVFFSEGKLFIAMECMEGSLKDALDDNKQFSEPVLRALVFQVLLGLKYLHEDKRQIHRDIKPHNILYNADGIVKLSDFGIASDKVETAKLFQKGTFCGTLVYMSPKRAVADAYSFEADLWSLGVSIMHLALGRLNIASSIFGIAALAKNPPRLPERSSSGVAFSEAMRGFVAATMPAADQPVPTARSLLAHPWLEGLTIDESRTAVRQALGHRQRSAPKELNSELNALDSVLK